MGCSSQNRQWSQQRMAVNATAICDSPSDRFRRRSSRTTTGRCRSWTKTSQDENMPISSKTQGDRTPKTPVTARRARVGGLCGFRSPAERVPVQQQKTGRCANVRECCGNGKRRRKPPAGGFQQREKPQAAKQDKRMASEPTLFLFTTARSADCIKGLRRRCDWRLFGEKYARLASEIPQMQTVQGIPARHAAD